MKIPIVYFALAAAAFSQPAVAPPRPGLIVDANGSLRPVFGFSGNFYLGDSAGEGVISLAFSGRSGLVKTASTIAVLDASGQLQFAADAVDGAALFAFAPDGSPAAAFLLSSGTLLAWIEGQPQPVPAALDGTPLAMAGLNGNRLAVVVQRDDGVWRLDLALADGTIIARQALPGVTAPVWLGGGGSLAFMDQGALVVRGPDGSEQRADAAFDAGEMRQMGDGWIELLDKNSKAGFAIRLSSRPLRMWQLPEEQQ